MAEIRRIPVSSLQRHKNRLGRCAVSCVVSDRWLRFSEHYQDVGDDRVVWVSVMTGDPDRPRKLCDLAVSLDELEDLIRDITPSGS